MWMSLILMLMFGNQTVNKPVVAAQKPVITWLTFEEAIAANKIKKKKIFINVYTSWCGWCKVMDSKTFADSTVAVYMNENYYCVKMDAEMKDTIQYRGVNFSFKPEYKSHELAISLLDRQMSYPSFVVLTEDEKRLTIMKGYLEKSVFLENVKSLVEYKEK